MGEGDPQHIFIDRNARFHPGACPDADEWTETTWIFFYPIGLLLRSSIVGLLTEARVEDGCKGGVFAGGESTVLVATRTEGNS